MADSEQLVDVDVTASDDQDAFELEFFGKPEEKKEEASEKVEPADVDTGDDEIEAEEPDEVDAPETDTEDEPEEDEESEPEHPKKNRKTAKERINELVAERRVIEARAAAERVEFERRFAEMEARLTNKEPEKDTAKPVSRGPDAGAPSPDDVDKDGNLVYPLGEFDPKYTVDLTRFTIRKENEVAKAEAVIEAEQRQAAERTETLTKNWEVKLTSTEETLPDLREKLAVLDTTFRSIQPELGVFLADTIMQMDRGPEVLYYLASNISEAQKIVASGPVAATIALGRLEGRLPSNDKAKEDNKDTKVSKAPKPPTATRGTGVATKVAPDTDDLDAFEREFFRTK